MIESLEYYAVENIFDFCSKNQYMHLLNFVLGIQPDDITDEFERLKSHTD